MTSLMMLFLVTMSVALLAVTKTVSDTERKKGEREQDIERLLDRVAQVGQHHGVTVDRTRNVIDFGERARFDSASYRLTADQTELLRRFVPEILAIARDELGRRWLKRIVVEGFADQRGS